MTADIFKYKVVFECLDTENTQCYVTIDCYGPNIPEDSSDNSLMLIYICKSEFTRLGVKPLRVEGINNDC